jgi:ATP-binding cassette subfamily B protein
MQNLNRQTFKIFWRHLKKYRGLFYLTVFATIVGAGTFVIPPLFYKDFFDILAGPLADVVKANLLLAILAKIAIFYGVGWLAWRVAAFSSSHWQAQVMADLYHTCFSYLQKHSTTFFNNSFVGSLVKRINRFPNTFLGLSDLLIFEILTLFLNTIFIGTVLWMKSWELGLGLLIWLIIFLAVNYAFSLHKLKYDIQRNIADSAVTGFLADTITSQQNIKLFNGYSKEQENLKEVVGKWKYLRAFSWSIANKFEAFQSFSMVVLELMIFYLAIKLWQRGLVGIGDFVLLQVYLINLFHRFWGVGQIIRRYYEFLSDATEMTEILETPHEIKDSPTAKPLVISKGEIDFKDVDFGYNSTRKIFDKFNLNIKSGEKVAIVGPSGAGKTSIINMFLRNYELSGGKICIDGQKLSQVTRDSLWQNVALVPQDPILFHRNLMENIRYGRHDATDEEVIEAAKMANAHNFISQFSEGYQTLVGERGIKLSGGERQRVAIARAILKNAPILVMDEATSSLDSESEQLIQEALVKLIKGKTSIIIAHRFSTIMKSDRIIVLREGKIVEEGSHTELVKIKDGLYADLWRRQVCGFIE